MIKETVAPPAEDGKKAPEVAQPVVDKNTKAPVVAKAEPSATKNQVSIPAAVKKPARKPTTDNKAVAKRPSKKAIPEQTTATPKMSAKPVKKAPAAAKEQAAEDPKKEKPAKVKNQTPKKPKLVRDSFTFPENDYALLATLKQRALTAGIEVKKSELLRASLSMLAGLDAEALAKAIGRVDRIKTGRPKK